MKIRGSLSAGFLLLANLTALHASVIFNLGNHPEPDEENVLFGLDQTGSIITGITNISNTGVYFTSNTDLLEVTSHGQANVDASDHVLNSITIALADGGTYLDLIINPFLGNRIVAGPATVTVVASDGTFTYHYPCGLDRGENYLTIAASPGETITSTTIYASQGFDDLRQTRISGIAAASQVPEPGSLLLLAGGLLILAARLMRQPSQR
jgi:hypothetical protein